jgi:hypothetical protein
LNIEDLWYRFALSFLFKSIVRPRGSRRVELLKYSTWLWHKSCANMMLFQYIGTKPVEIDTWP